MSADATVIHGRGSGQRQAHAHDHGVHGRGQDHDHRHDRHDHHDHEHDHAGDQARRRPAAPRPARSLLALSGWQRLALAAPAIAALWLLTAWAMGLLTP